MTAATANAKPGKTEKPEKVDNREMISVNGTPEALAAIDRLRNQTRLSKRWIVLLGIHAFENLSAAQRESLIKKHPLSA